MSTSKITELFKILSLLQKKFCNGKNTSEKNAERVWEFDSAFIKHKLDYFRTKSSSLKAGDAIKKDAFEQETISFQFFPFDKHV